jgi:hypothetical protein
MASSASALSRKGDETLMRKLVNRGGFIFAVIYYMSALALFTVFIGGVILPGQTLKDHERRLLAIEGMSLEHRITKMEAGIEEAKKGTETSNAYMRLALIGISMLLGEKGVRLYGRAKGARASRLLLPPE